MNEYLYSTSADPNPRAILRIEEVLHRTGLKRTMLYDLIRKEEFPNQVSLGARAVGWYEEQVEEWIKTRSVVRSSHGVLLQDLNREMNTAPEVFEPFLGVETRRAGQRTSRRRYKEAPQPELIRPVKQREPERAKRNRASTESVRTTIDPKEFMRLRDENDRLKRLIADLILRNDMLQSGDAK